MFIICADYTTKFVIWQGIMTHREDVFFLFPLLFLYIIPYTLRGGFLFNSAVAKRNLLPFGEVLFFV